MLRLTDHIEEAYQAEDRRYLGFSQVGSCLRKAWFKTHHPELATPLSAATILTFEDGHLHEMDVIERMRRAGYWIARGPTEWERDGFYDHDQFTLVSDDPAFEGNFLGHPDGIVEIPTEDGPRYHLLEIKSKSDRSWRYAHKNGIRAGAWDNYCQVQMSLHYRGQLETLLGMTIEPVALLVAKAKQDARESDDDTNGILAEYEIAYNEEDARAVISFEINKYLALKRDTSPPEPIFFNKDREWDHHDPRTADNRGTNSALCRSRYCSYREACLSAGGL